MPTCSETLRTASDARLPAADRDRALAHIAQDLAAKRLLLVDVVTALGDLLTSTDDALRNEGTWCLAELLARSHPGLASFPVPIKDLRSLFRFFTDRMTDYPCIKPVLRGAVAIVQHTDAHADDVMALAQSVFTSVSVQMLPQASRHDAYRIFYFLVTRFSLEITERSSEFTLGFLQVMDGEKDPRNLLICFNVISKFLVQYQDSLSPILEEVFEGFCCYFPITFNNSSDDPLAVSSEELKGLLRNCFCAADALVGHSIPFLLDRSSAMASATRIEVMKALTVCFKYFKRSLIFPFFSPICDFLLRNCFDSAEDDCVSVSISSISEIMAILADDDVAWTSFSALVLKAVVTELSILESKRARTSLRLLESLFSNQRVFIRCFKQIWEGSLQDLLTMASASSPSSALIFMEFLSKVLRTVSLWEFSTKHSDVLTVFTELYERLLITYRMGFPQQQCFSINCLGSLYLFFFQFPEDAMVDKTSLFEQFLATISDCLLSSSASRASKDSIPQILECFDLVTEKIGTFGVDDVLSKFIRPLVDLSDLEESRKENYDDSFYAWEILQKLAVFRNPHVSSFVVNYFLDHLSSFSSRSLSDVVIPKFSEVFSLKRSFFSSLVSEKILTTTTTLSGTVKAGNISEEVSKSFLFEFLLNADQKSLSLALKEVLPSSSVLSSFKLVLVACCPKNVILDNTALISDFFKAASAEPMLHDFVLSASSVLNKTCLESDLLKDLAEFYVSQLNLKAIGTDMVFLEKNARIAVTLTKALVIRNHSDGHRFLSNIISLLFDSVMSEKREIAVLISNSLSKLARDTAEGFLSKQIGCQISPLYKQRLCLHLFDEYSKLKDSTKFVDASQKDFAESCFKNALLGILNSSSDAMIKEKGSIVFSFVLSSLQQPLSTAHLLSALQVGKRLVLWSSWDRATLEVMIATLLKISRDDLAQIRTLALELLTAIGGCDFDSVMGFRGMVVKGVALSLDDSKRDVRQEARKCRNKWFLLKKSQ